MSELPSSPSAPGPSANSSCSSSSSSSFSDPCPPATSPGLLRRQLEAGYWWCFAACLFLAYPIALVCPVRTGPSLVFYFALPTLFIGSLFAGLWLLANAVRELTTPPTTVAEPSRRLRQALWCAFLLVAGLCVWNGSLQHSTGMAAVVETLGLMAIPLWFALVPRVWSTPRLATVLGLLWLANVAHAGWQWHVHFEAVGLAGNRNWQATLTVALAPWAWLAVARSGSVPRIWLTRGALALVAGASLFFAYQGESRATWLVLGVYVLLFGVLARLSWLGRVLLCAGLGLMVFAAVVAMPGRIVQAIDQDIRVPLWAQTVRMIGDRPWLGAGPGNYRREFVLYKSAAHKQRIVAAAVTEHPHNEPLHVAAIMGLPWAAAWLLLWFPLLWRRVRTRAETAMHFSAWMICGHACFDQTLAQPPTCLLGLMFLGLLWRNWLPPAPVTPTLDAEAGRPALARIVIIAMAVVAAAGVIEAGRRACLTWYLREGWLAEARADVVAAHAAYAQAARVYPTEVQAHMLAGMMAANGLRNTPLALEHFQRVLELDPNYAHVNGEAGGALGSLGRHDDALQLLAREAALYPYDALALRRLLVARLATGRVDGIEQEEARLAQLDYRRAVQKLGEPAVAALSEAFVSALRRGDAVAGSEAAQQISSSTVHDWMADPAFYLLAPAVHVPDEFAYLDFGPGDWRYWNGLQSDWVEAVRVIGFTRGPLDLVFKANWLSPERLDGVWRAAAQEPRRFAAMLYQAGWEVARLGTAPDMLTGAFELRKGEQCWLVAPDSGIWIEKTDVGRLRQDPVLAARFGWPTGTAPRLRLYLECEAYAFAARTAILAHVLCEGEAALTYGTGSRRALSAFARGNGVEAVLLPRVGEMPSLRLVHYRHLQAASGTAQPPVELLMLPSAAGASVPK